MCSDDTRTHRERERERGRESERNPCQPKLRLSGARIGAKAPLTFAHCGQNFIVAMAAVRSPPRKDPLLCARRRGPPLSLGRGPSSDRAGPPLRDGMPSPGRHLRGYLVDLRVFLPLPLTPLEPLPPIEPSPPPGAFPRRTPPPKAVSPSIFWRATFQGKVPKATSSLWDPTRWDPDPEDLWNYRESG